MKKYIQQIRLLLTNTDAILAPYEVLRHLLEKICQEAADNSFSLLRGLSLFSWADLT